MKTNTGPELSPGPDNLISTEKINFTDEGWARWQDDTGKLALRPGKLCLMWREEVFCS